MKRLDAECSTHAAPSFPRHLGGAQAGAAQTKPLPHAAVGKPEVGETWPWAISGTQPGPAGSGGSRRLLRALDMMPSPHSSLVTKEQYPRKWLLRDLLRVSNGQI